MGLVCFLSGSEIRISGISGISLLFERRRSRDNAPSFWLWDWFDFSLGMVSRWCAHLWIAQPHNGVGVAFERDYFAMMRLPLGCTTHQFTFGLLLYGHTYLSRAHTTVQLLTMFKGTQKCCSKSVCSTYPWSCVVWAHISVALSYHSAMHDHVQGDC